MCMTQFLRGRFKVTLQILFFCKVKFPFFSTWMNFFHTLKYPHSWTIYTGDSRKLNLKDYIWKLKRPRPEACRWCSITTCTSCVTACSITHNIFWKLREVTPTSCSFSESAVNHVPHDHDTQISLISSSSLSFFSSVSCISSDSSISSVLAISSVSQTLQHSFDLSHP